MSKVLGRNFFIWQDEAGNWVARVPSLPGCNTQGTTFDEALINAREAIEAYIECFEMRGEQIPADLPNARVVRT